MTELGAVDLVKQGIAEARSGDKTHARTLLWQAVECDPANESAWMWLASVAESPQGTLTALERVLAINPGHEQARSAVHAARLKVGVIAAKAHEIDDARALLRDVIAAEPENELAWMWLANVADTPADAATCLERVLAINPENKLARSTYERCRSVARLVAIAAPAAPSNDQPKRDHRDAPQLSHKMVLAVDVDPAVREALAQVLGENGYHVVVAADGYEAVKVLRDEGEPNLVLAAAALPGGMDGYQLCKLLRENAATAQVPLILLSETSSFVSKMRGRMAGAAAELVKPFEPADLLRVVKELCPV